MNATNARLPREFTNEPPGSGEDADLTVDGFSIHRSFLDHDLVVGLNDELDQLFRRPLFNTVAFGSIWTRYVVEVSSPSAMTSLNMLELCIDVFHASVPRGRQDRMRLTNLEVFSTHVETTDLFWHTDRRRGMVRAQIYLRGGEIDSGGFQYMAGTHVEHDVEHALSEAEVSMLDNRVIDCSGLPGDMVVFDAFGFHAMGRCRTERRTIMFEFQDADSPDGKSSINLNNRALTRKVIENLDLFLPSDNADHYSDHGLDRFLDTSEVHTPSAALRLIGRALAESWWRRFLPVRAGRKMARRIQELTGR